MDTDPLIAELENENGEGDEDEEEEDDGNEEFSPSDEEVARLLEDDGGDDDDEEDNDDDSDNDDVDLDAENGWWLFVRCLRGNSVDLQKETYVIIYKCVDQTQTICLSHLHRSGSRAHGSSRWLWLSTKVTCAHLHCGSKVWGHSLISALNSIISSFEI